MYEVIRWISMGLMWLATGLNVYAMVRCVRARKELEVQTKLMEAYIAHKMERGEWKCIEVEVSDTKGEN